MGGREGSLWYSVIVKSKKVSDVCKVLSSYVKRAPSHDKTRD